MKVKEIFWVLLIYLELFLFGTLFFVLLFQTPIFAGVNVFFYRGILLLIVSSAITFLISLVVWLLSKKGLFTFRDVIISLTLVFCINLVFFTHLPVTAERSISVFLLSYMDNNFEKALTEDEITDVFIQKYLFKNKNIMKRFNEQVVTGNVMEENGKFIITRRGMRMVRIYNFVSNLFNMNKQNIRPF